MTPARRPPIALAYDERELPGVAGRVLLDGDDVGDAAAGLVLAAHRVARALRGDHDHVDALGRLDVAEADVEAVRRTTRVLPARQVVLDVVGVDAALVLVGREDHDDVGPLGGVGDRLRPRSRPPRPSRFDFESVLEADDDLDARVAQVLRVGVALRAVADDGDLLALDERQVGVLVVEDLSHVVFLLVWSALSSSRYVILACPEAGVSS